MELLGLGAEGYGDELLWGFALTLWLALASFFLSCVVGLLLGFVALSRRRLARGFWRGYRSVAMGVPSVLAIFFVYFNLPYLLRSILAVDVEITALTAGIVALTLVYAAYTGEVVRGAVSNVPAGQFEAARALGVGTFHLWRLVVIPQAFRLALPGLTNIWLILLKDTALVSLVGLEDIVRVANIAAGTTQEPFLFYIVAMLAFVAVAGLSMMAVHKAEAWAGRGFADAR